MLKKKRIKATDKVEPGVGGEDLVLLVDVDDLLERQAEADDHLLRFVGHGPFQRVVVAEQVVQQTLLVGPGPRTTCSNNNNNNNNRIKSKVVKIPLNKTKRKSAVAPLLLFLGSQ